MSSETYPKILLTGASGYIGGTILNTIISSTDPAFKSKVITLLVRGSDRVETLKSKYGDRVNPVLYRDLDDVETATAVASQHDLIISATHGFHEASAQALVEGLGKRKAATGKEVCIIHTSGTSNMSDQFVSGKYVEKIEGREFDDAKDDIYGYETERNAQTPYPQRTTELGLVDKGLELGVKTLVIMSGLIYGSGTGLYHNTSIQIPTYATSTAKYGKGVVIGEGKGTWDRVHVEDLADLYKVVALHFIENGGSKLPQGKKSIIYSGNGRFTWAELAQRVADAVYDEGKINDKTVESIGIDQATKVLKVLGYDDPDTIEMALSSNSRTVSSVGRSLGWKPTRGNEAWAQTLKDDVKVALASM